MPLIYVQRYAVTQAFKEGGTQYVDGVLSFGNPTTIYLSNAVFGQTGDYVLFDYSGSSSPNPFPGGQTELNNNVTVNYDDLLLSKLYSLTNDTVNKRIVLSLRSRETNGTQYVDNNLTIADGSRIYLNDTLYATAGTYVLFDVTGTITATLSGGSPNYLTGLDVYSLKGLAVVGNKAFKDGNQIKVTLA